MSTENKTPDPANVSELARETAEKLRMYYAISKDDNLPETIQSALSKLAAEKDAEIARHVAALKVARDALEVIRSIYGDGFEVDNTASVALQHIDKELL